MRKNGLAILGRALGKESKHLEREQKSDSVRKRERRKIYLGLPNIGPPTIENSKAHKTNRL